MGPTTVVFLFCLCATAVGGTDASPGNIASAETVTPSLTEPSGPTSAEAAAEATKEDLELKAEEAVAPEAAETASPDSAKTAPKATGKTTGAPRLTFPLALRAARPWSFTATVGPVALGSALAFKLEDAFNVPVLLLTLATTLSVHAAGNLMNTYFDYVHKVDSPTSSDLTLVNKQLLPEQMVKTRGSHSACTLLSACIALDSWLCALGAA